MKERIIWIDAVKVAAIFSVLILHAASPMLYKLGKIDFPIWQIANIYDSLVRMAVPLFFMVSGALLLNQKEESLSTFFSKRFVKVIIPLVAWSIIYILFRKYALNQNIDISDHLFELFYKKQYFHLWFLYTLLGLYLFIPIFKVFVQHSSKTLQLYFLSLWMITVAIIPIINKFSDITIPNYLPMLSGHIGFLLIGYMLSKITISKKIFSLSILLIILTSCITIYGTHELYIEVNKFQSFFYKNLSLTTIIQSVSYFIVIRYLAIKLTSNTNSNQTLITQLSLTSFGVYLIHPIFLKLLRSLDISIFTLHGYKILYVIPLTAIAVWVLSFIAVTIIQRIPYVKAIVP